MANLVMDISSYQPDSIDFFQAAKNAGVKAVIVKLTQGSADGDAYVNPKAQAQLNNARAVGLLVHGYHYAGLTAPRTRGTKRDGLLTMPNSLGWDRNRS